MTNVFERELTVAAGILAGRDAPDLEAEILAELRRPTPAVAKVYAPRRRWAAAVLVAGALAVVGVGVSVWSGQRPAPARVLWIEGAPRWDYRLRRNELLRDADVALQCYLTGAAAGFEQEHSPGLPALRRIPGLRSDVATARAELAQYDVVLLGDVAPADLSAEPETIDAFAQALTAFVRDGGGVAVLAGPRGMPEAWHATTLRDLLPVHAPLRSGEPPQPVVPRPDAAGRSHPMVRLDDDAERSASIWSTLTLSAFAPVGALVEGAQTLLVGRRDDGNDVPLLVTRTLGEGRVALWATDETWRLRATAPAAFGRLCAHQITWLRSPRRHR